MFLFSYILLGDIMLFIKGFLVGIGKIIPGVSGAILAINFKVYERLLDSLANFFGNPKENIKFLLVFGLGIFISIILGSNIILYLLSNYKFITMMFFLGLILGGTYNFSKSIKFNYKNIILIITLVSLFILISSFNISINNNKSNIIFFVGGIIEVLASIVPGISATSLLMMFGIYDDIIMMIAKLFDFNYVIHNINLYLSYGLGMFISFIINIYLINYLLKKYKDQSYIVILILTTVSIIFLIKMICEIKITLILLTIGIMVLILGLLLSCILTRNN